MKTECTLEQIEFQGLGKRRVVAEFDGENISSDGGALLLRETDELLAIIERFSSCFTDHRDPDAIEHSVLELLRQRIYGLALGYEDLNDHDDLMRDMLLAVAVGKADPEGNERARERDVGKSLASSSTLNRIELTPGDATAQSRYKKIVHDPARIEELFVDLFLDSFDVAPAEIILDFDATDDPLHGSQEGRFYHGYYQCYCYLPLYVTCGEHLLVAQLRQSNQDASAGSEQILARLVERIRARWSEVNIIVRGDSGFARDGLMNWCETHDVYYLFGLAKNSRLLDLIARYLETAHIHHILTGTATREFTSFEYQTLNSWTRPRRVVAKAEYLRKGPNPRFVVTNLPEHYAAPDSLYEDIYCARGDMENRIKEQQLDLFADRTSTSLIASNQLRLWFSSIAYVLVSAMRRIGLKNTRMAKCTCGTIRTKLFKVGAQVKVSVRRFMVHLAHACPHQDVFKQVLLNLQSYPLRC